MFSKACEYGIRAVIYIVSKSKSGKRLSIKEISKKADAPEPFTAKILQQLVRAGIVASVKGPNGGFYIEENAKEIMLIDIVTAIDGKKLFIGCGLGLKQCSEIKPCPIHNEFKVIRDNLQHLLQNTSVHTLSDDLAKGIVFLKK
jgi:Rrf2 family transcriptional regulator, iron-sulfur cluster assembly transcription factor